MHGSAKEAQESLALMFPFFSLSCDIRTPSLTLHRGLSFSTSCSPPNKGLAPCGSAILPGEGLG